MAGLLLARLFRKNARFVGQLLGKAEAQEGVNMSQYARQPFRGKAVCLLKKKKTVNSSAFTVQSISWFH